MIRAAFVAGLVLVSVPGTVSGQVRGFVDAGGTRFTAQNSFATILGTSGGAVFGGGVEVGLLKGTFITLRASHFTRSGRRVLLFEGERFPLDIETRVSVTPVELSAGWRLPAILKLIPYGAGGIGWHRYREQTETGTNLEDVDRRFVGYQLLGGVEFRVWRWLGAAGEAQWGSVPNALASEPNGVSSAFGETDLGGGTIRIKVIIGP